MFCSAVSAGSRLNDWKTKPTRLRRSRVSARSDSPDSSAAPILTEPEVGVSRPARQYEQPGSDLGVGQPGSHLNEDLPLPLGELGQVGRRGTGGGQQRHEPVDQPPGGRRCDDGIASVHRTDREQQLGRRHVFQQEAAGPRLEPGECVLVQVERGQHQQPRLLPGGADPPGRLDPVQPRHPHVHHHDVGRPQHRAAEQGRLHADRIQAVHGMDRVPPPGGDHRAGQADGQPAQRYPARPAGRQRVEHDQHGQVRPGRPAQQQHLQRADGDDRGERRHRVLAPEHHRHHHAEGERQRDQQAAASGIDQQQGQRAVHQPGVAAQPGVQIRHLTRVRSHAARRRPPSG